MMLIKYLLKEWYSARTMNTVFIYFVTVPKQLMGLLCMLVVMAYLTIFAKTKMAPLKELSIPCLELMAVVLAFKCLPNILSSFEDIKFKFLNFVVDAQVVLTWLLTNNPKSKSKMVKNRLKDIELAKTEIISEFKVPIFFRYTDTNSNPADLLTKGISFKKFNELKHFWEHGPPFLSNNFADWPVHDLLNIPPECKAKLSVNCSSVNSIDDKDVYEIEKF